MMNYNPLCMKGKTILVTGSASGIGAETAIQIAKLGGDLLLWDIDRDGLVKTENVCREFGSKVHYDVVDLIDNASINDTLLKKLKDIKYSYDLKDEDVEIVFKIKEELASERGEYDDLIEDGRSKNFSYSHLNKHMDALNIKVLKTEEKLDIALRTLGSLKEDELRAREQLDEMKGILNDAKMLMKSFKLPFIPEVYFIELSEATEAISNMIHELEKTPISIKVLNTRVDTARDLVLKFYNTTKEMIKTAKMAETAIVYGNRYRAVEESVALGLAKAENAFIKGNYKLSLESSIHAINIIEPGIYKKLMDEYQS